MKLEDACASLRGTEVWRTIKTELIEKKMQHAQNRVMQPVTSSSDSYERERDKGAFQALQTLVQAIEIQGELGEGAEDDDDAD